MGLWQILKGEQPGLIKSLLHYRNAGQFGEYLIDYALQSEGVEGECVVLTNLYLPMKGKTTEIDLLMLHEKGIFVIESKYYSGWIFGSEDQLKWTQCFRNGRKEHFYVHDYTRLGEIVEGPYCETEGKRWMYCSYEGCNERVLKPVPAIGYHDWDTEHTECLKEATCTEKGTMLMHCKRDASHTMTYDYGGTGHVWDEGVITTPPTYDEYGEKTLNCKNCDATKTEKVLPTKYTFTVTVVQPTCTEDGYTMHKCNEDDSFSYKDNIVHATGHRAAKRVIEPTCKEEGRTEIYCIVCGEVSSTFDVTPKKEHTWDDGVVTTKPTAEKEGVKTYTCKVCNETKTETIPRLNSSGK